MSGLDILSTLAAQALALGLATERIIAILKTWFPTFLAEPPVTDPPATDPEAQKKEKWRRTRVQLVAFFVAWGAASFLVSGSASPFGRVPLGPSGDPSLPAWIFALLSCGGSAFWSQVISILSILKDLRGQKKALNARALAAQTRQDGADHRADAVLARPAPASPSRKGTPSIPIDASGGDVSFRVTAGNQPHVVAGKLWGYDANGDGYLVGVIRPRVDTVNMGPPSGILGRSFCFEGAILAVGDGTSSQYRIAVSVIQDDAIPYDDVCASGTIGDHDVPITFSFGIVP